MDGTSEDAIHFCGETYPETATLSPYTFPLRAPTEDAAATVRDSCQHYLAPHTDRTVE